MASFSSRMLVIFDAVMEFNQLDHTNKSRFVKFR